MTKITIRQRLNLDKTEFRDLVEFLAYLGQFLGENDNDVTEVGVLGDEEVTPEMRAKMEEVKHLSQTNSERFIDIR